MRYFAINDLSGLTRAESKKRAMNSQQLAFISRKI